MSNFNISVIEGHLTKDPSFEILKGEHPFCRFSVAVNRQFTKKDGEKVEEVQFFEVTSWYRQAEICGKYLKKGSRVLVSGHLKKDVWKDKDGQTQSKTYLEAKEINFLSGAERKERQEPVPV